MQLRRLSPALLLTHSRSFGTKRTKASNSHHRLPLQQVAPPTAGTAYLHSRDLKRPSRCYTSPTMSAAGPEQPFKLHVSDVDIDTLHKKLALVRFPDELDDAGWNYGVPLAHVKRLVERWQAGFDWRKSEEEINKLPQFTRDIPVDGFGTLNIHYVHQTSEQANAIPLLFVHGCRLQSLGRLANIS